MKNISIIAYQYSDHAIRINVDNTMPNRLLGNANALISTLKPVLTRFGEIEIISGYRCKSLNDSYKPNNCKGHTKGLALDFRVPTVNNKTVAEWIYFNEEIVFNNIHITRQWIHISIDGKPLRQYTIEEGL